MKKEISLTKKYQKKIDWKGKPNELCLATSTAIYLIIDRKFTLKTAIKASALKNGVKKAPLERSIKECIPASFFAARRKAFMTPEMKQDVRNRKIQQHEDRKRIAAL